MSRFFAWVLTLAVALGVSGCALIGKHTVPTAHGERTTVGLLAIEGMGDGYPMLPLYSSTRIGKK